MLAIPPANGRCTDKRPLNKQYKVLVLLAHISMYCRVLTCIVHVLSMNCAT